MANHRNPKYLAAGCFAITKSHAANVAKNPNIAVIGIFLPIMGILPFNLNGLSKSGSLIRNPISDRCAIEKASIAPKLYNLTRESRSLPIRTITTATVENTMIDMYGVLYLLCRLLKSEGS